MTYKLLFFVTCVLCIGFLSGFAYFAIAHREADKVRTDLKAEITRLKADNENAYRELNILRTDEETWKQSEDDLKAEIIKLKEDNENAFREITRLKEIKDPAIKLQTNEGKTGEGEWKESEVSLKGEIKRLQEDEEILLQALSFVRVDDTLTNIQTLKKQADVLEKAFEILQRKSDFRKYQVLNDIVSITLVNIGKAHVGLGNGERGHDFLDRVRIDQLYGREYIEAQKSLAKSNILIGNYELAKLILKMALKYVKKNYPDWTFKQFEILSSLVNVYMKSRDETQAINTINCINQLHTNSRPALLEMFTPMFSMTSSYDVIRLNDKFLLKEVYSTDVKSLGRLIASTVGRDDPIFANYLLTFSFQEGNLRERRQMVEEALKIRIEAFGKQHILVSEAQEILTRYLEEAQRFFS